MNKAGKFTLPLISASKRKSFSKSSSRLRIKQFLLTGLTVNRRRSFHRKKNSTISFKSSGAIPIPNFDLQRNVNSGGFTFNFNLNFAPNFAVLLEEGAKFIENPYISTNKGRDVLLSYFLNQGAFWFLPPAPVQRWKCSFSFQP